MANTNITTSQASGFIPEVWLNVALGRLRNYLTIQKCVTRDTDLDSTQKFNVGQTLHLPKRGSLSVNDKAENQNYTVQNPSSSTVDLTLNKHKEVTFGVESRAIATANQNVIQGYVEDACIALAEQIDVDLLSLVTSFTGGTIVNAGNITEANIITAWGYLVTAQVPASMKKYGICGVSQAQALFQIDRLVRYDSLGVSNDITNAQVGGASGAGPFTMAGALGKLYNFELAVTQLIPNAASPLYDRNAFFSEDAILFASRPLENPDGNLGVQATVITDPESGISLRLMHSYQHLQGAHVLTLDVLYGYTMMRPTHGVQIQTAA